MTRRLALNLALIDTPGLFPTPRLALVLTPDRVPLLVGAVPAQFQDATTSALVVTLLLPATQAKRGPFSGPQEEKYTQETPSEPPPGLGP
ncbi:hypothetical protein A0H81_06634 [Grifola frondosa]|uniref:Uncharacterized protein n=1 Tax=Grifola frondosa TaxID=5627 RepID=A0A1C7M850_GRIFR|nr:hypothetical protein A0H81_06634 [Grifola frondosa]